MAIGDTAGGMALVRITPLNQTTFVASGAATLYSIQKYKVNEKSKTGEVTSTNSSLNVFSGTSAGVHGEDIPCVTQADIEIVEATYNSVANLFSTPVVLASGTFVQIEIFPNTLTSTPWNFTVALITECDHDGDATALQPITLRLKSQGAYSRPA